MSDLISLGSLAVAAIALIVGFAQRSKATAARDQLVIDKIDNQTNEIREIKTTIDKVDGKTDDHSVRIARLEGEMNDHRRRLDRVEGRCERHFGPSMHDE